MSIKKIRKMPYSEVNELERFDLLSPVRRQSLFWIKVARVLILPELIMRRHKLTKVNMEGLKKKPYILFVNHNSFYDYNVTLHAIKPNRSTFVVAVDGFLGLEGIMRKLGCFGKRKFYNDTNVIRQIRRTIKDYGDVPIVYPEARYSHVGTTAILPDSLGKLVKLMKVPVVTLLTEGNHLVQPVWNLKKRKVRTSATLTQIITEEEARTLSIDELNDRIEESLQYDDYKMQKEKGIRIKEKFRAEGLESVLYKCPSCKTEGLMSSKDYTLTCDSCSKSYELDEYNVISATEGVTEFTHIPDWYEWQREEVRKEIEDGTYYFEHEVSINMLPNQTMYEIGTGTLIHNLEGFKVTGSGFGETFEFTKEPLENYGVHIEFNFHGRGHGISFSTFDDSYWMFSKERSYLITKVHFAVEELYKIKVKEKGLD